MIVKNEALLDEFRHAWHCEWCRMITPEGADPAHIFAKGLGGGSRLDIRINLVALCRECHVMSHAGHRPLQCDLLAVVAARHFCQQDDIQEVIWALKRIRKREEAESQLADMNFSARTLFLKTLEEIA